MLLVLYSKYSNFFLFILEKITIKFIPVYPKLVFLKEKKIKFTSSFNLKHVPQILIIKYMQTQRMSMSHIILNQQIGCWFITWVASLIFQIEWTFLIFIMVTRFLSVLVQQVHLIQWRVFLIFIIYSKKTSVF